MNTHRSNVMRNNKVMALDEGVRLICGLTTSKLTLEKSGFQRHNLLGYLNELRMSRPYTNVVTQSLAHLNVENPAFAEDVASFCKKPVFVKLSKEDPLGAQMVTRLVQVHCTRPARVLRAPPWFRLLRPSPGVLLDLCRPCVLPPAPPCEEPRGVSRAGVDGCARRR